MPAAMAASLITELETACPRPRGRSGCVTTASTVKSGWEMRSRRVGRPNSGVPQKTIRIVRTYPDRLPLAGFLQLANTAADHVPADQAEVLDEQDPVQMVGFVAERARQQSLAVHFECLAG